MLKKLLPLVTLLIAICAFAQQTPTHFDGKTWWDYVKVLADDNMEGRETGSAGAAKGGGLRRRPVEVGGPSACGD